MRLSFQAADVWPTYSNDLTKIAPLVEPAQWLNWQQSDQLYYCVFNQRVVAYCVVAATGEALVVNRFSVRELTQRRGIGLFMFQQLLQLAESKQLNYLQFPHSNDAPALGFYQHLGLNNQFEFKL
ncbi:acetyl-CoA sensor PanZ family protein [Agarivorans sp. MS3-6]|uniref:acetyl-CoA sensor PanZ family protein n=1 Tax=Agarivorans sp. TSD2052 TaxID=2937286 RepID=UPI00200E8082|nr:acetyl-CoA sensor PanZ family protein [Agarivorans sp. TSD2052]UPW19078.1 PanM family protein [Agarivorans sp. TSD2052]